MGGVLRQKVSNKMIQYQIIDGMLHLPDGLTVGGRLDLTGCTGLTALPDGLDKHVKGSIWGGHSE